MCDIEMTAEKRAKKEARLKRMSRRDRKFTLALLVVVAATLLLAFLPQPALAATPITNCTGLQNIRTNLDGDYYLANDINCSCTSDWNGGAGFAPIGNLSNKFTGTFDGKNRRITNLYINRSSTDNVGLFGVTDSGSEIKDVGLEEVDVRGSSHVGGLVGYNLVGTIRNSYASGAVSGSVLVGGLVGENGGTITNAYYPEDDITCTGCDNSFGNTTKANLQNETWLTTAPNDWDFDTVWGLVEGVTYPYLRWQYAPKITSFAPSSPVNDTVCTWRTFNVSVTQEVNVSWYLNGSFLFTNESVTEANCTLHATWPGEHNVSALVTNQNGTAMQTWIWNVRATSVIIPTATGTGNVTINTSSGYFCSETRACAASEFPCMPDSPITCSHGFFNLSICGLNTSTAENVTINFTFPSPIPTDAEFWKYNSSNGTWYRYDFGDNDGDNVISITITDNGPGDHNPALGIIGDPNGIGWLPPPVPAMTPIGLVALIGLLSGIAAVTITKGKRR
jgi:hypothetical protein